MIIYKHPRKGIFSIHTGEWGKNGWINEEQEFTILGETEHDYITRFYTTSDAFNPWDEKEKYEAHYTTSVGIHKSRFVKWVATQLNIFN